MGNRFKTIEDRPSCLAEADSVHEHALHHYSYLAIVMDQTVVAPACFRSFAACLRVEPVV